MSHEPKHAREEEKMQDQSADSSQEKTDRASAPLTDEALNDAAGGGSYWEGDNDIDAGSGS